mmetsp:Transcript_64593/g.174534  ORF Transcript_64593/g.174534 Transcript_64593/m.174534 type:complete len:258 (+) Transcript_64593:692-1465(+)
MQVRIHRVLGLALSMADRLCVKCDLFITPLRQLEALQARVGIAILAAPDLVVLGLVERDSVQQSLPVRLLDRKVLRLGAAVCAPAVRVQALQAGVGAAFGEVQPAVPAAQALLHLLRAHAVVVEAQRACQLGDPWIGNLHVVNVPRCDEVRERNPARPLEVHHEPHIMDDGVFESHRIRKDESLPLVPNNIFHVWGRDYLFKDSKDRREFWLHFVNEEAKIQICRLQWHSAHKVLLEVIQAVGSRGPGRFARRRSSA